MFPPEAESDTSHLLARQLRSDALLLKTLTDYLEERLKDRSDDFTFAAKAGVMNPDKLQSAALALGRVYEIQSLLEAFATMGQGA